jgi:hypothetical protein
MQCEEEVAVNCELHEPHKYTLCAKLRGFILKQAVRVDMRGTTYRYVMYKTDTRSQWHFFGNIFFFFLLWQLLNYLQVQFKRDSVMSENQHNFALHSTSPCQKPNTQ